jgi:histidine triad (HIT) family protein
MPNIFEDILAGRAPGSFIYRDERVAAFMDIQPINAGHVLVAPIRSVQSLHELDDATAAHLFVIGRRIAVAIRQSGLCCDGINLFLADGAAAGQEVPHLHLHVFPRCKGDGFRLQFGPASQKRPTRATLDETARQIGHAMKGNETPMATISVP